MNDTCTLIIIKSTDDITVRYNMPMHKDMQQGLPWVYIDNDGEKYYPIYLRIFDGIYLVQWSGIYDHKKQTA